MDLSEAICITNRGCSMRNGRLEFAEDLLHKTKRRVTQSVVPKGDRGVLTDTGRRRGR